MSKTYLCQNDHCCLILPVFKIAVNIYPLQFQSMSFLFAHTAADFVQSIFFKKICLRNHLLRWTTSRILWIRIHPFSTICFIYTSLRLCCLNPGSKALIFSVKRLKYIQFLSKDSINCTLTKRNLRNSTLPSIVAEWAIKVLNYCMTLRPSF